MGAADGRGGATRGFGGAGAAGGLRRRRLRPPCARRRLPRLGCGKAGGCWLFMPRNRYRWTSDEPASLHASASDHLLLGWITRKAGALHRDCASPLVLRALSAISVATRGALRGWAAAEEASRVHKSRNRSTHGTFVCLHQGADTDSGVGQGLFHRLVLYCLQRCAQAHQERAYCASNFLSHGTLTMIEGMRQQLLGELTGRRLVKSLGDASATARDAGLVRCVLVRLQTYCIHTESKLFCVCKF